MLINNKLGNMIAQAREAKRWTQDQMASKLGMSLRQYRKYESGIFPKYKLDTLHDIDTILGTKVAALLQAQNVPHENEATQTYVEGGLAYDSTKGKLVRREIPFFDASAPSGSEVNMDQCNPSGTIDVGDLLNDSEIALRIYGNSMTPNYPPGCVVGLAKVNESFIEPGEVYVVETPDRRLLKRLFYKDDLPGDRITCYSDNITTFDGGSRNGKLVYPPFEISRKDIKSLYIVTGVIKRNTNSSIINK